MAQVEDPDPLSILSHGLQQSAADLTEEASARLVKSSADMIVNETETQAPQVITNETIEALYDRIAGTKVIGYLPAGSRVIGSKDTKTKVDPSTGRITVVAPIEPIRSNVRPEQTARTSMQQANQSFPIEFDLETEMAKLKGLRGQELSNAITQTLSTIDTQITKRKIDLGKVAAVESGYASAQAALERTLQAEQLPNPNFGGLSFNQRFGMASAQAVQAEQFASTTRIQMLALEKSMIEKDLDISKLASAKNAILKLELRTVQRQMAEEDKLDAITSQQTANYKFLYDTTGQMDDLTAKRAIFARKADPVLTKTVQLTPENAYTILLDPDLRVRENAFKLLIEWDKAANNLDPSATQTPISERIKEFIKEPTKILDASLNIGAISKDDAKRLKTQWLTADTKEKASMQQGALASLLEKYIERQFEISYGNMKKWRANELDPKLPLGQVVDRIAKTTSDGHAYLPTVIDMFIRDSTIKDPATQQVLNYQQKLQILDSALGGTISSEFKTLLYPNTDPLRIKMANTIKNLANKAYINSQLDQYFRTGLQGLGLER